MFVTNLASVTNLNSVTLSLGNHDLSALTISVWHHLLARIFSNVRIILGCLTSMVAAWGWFFIVSLWWCYLIWPSGQISVTFGSLNLIVTLNFSKTFSQLFFRVKQISVFSPHTSQCRQLFYMSSVFLEYAR
jgi:hypothetical protein